MPASRLASASIVLVVIAASCGDDAQHFPSGAAGTGGPICTPVPETCDGFDNDCNGIIDDSAGLCGGPGEVCKGGACIVDCVAADANACPDGQTCNVSDKNPGACIPLEAGCVVTGAFETCGAKLCGPGTSCDATAGACLPALPCQSVVCDGDRCHGATCPCDRPAPSCATATLAQLNAPAFMSGLADLDFDLSCGAWGVTVLSGPDYLRHMGSTGEVTSVAGITNLNMGEVAVLQDISDTKSDVVLTYNCCATCGCQGTTPQGIAYYDQMANALPLFIPSAKTTTGSGPFKSIALDTGPHGLTWALPSNLYVGNVDQNGDFYAINLATSEKNLVAMLPARVYASAPYDGKRLLVALATRDIVLLDSTAGTTAPFATMSADVTSLARDPFSGHVYVSLFGGEIRQLGVNGQDLGVFAKGSTSGRIALARDNYLYHLNVAPGGAASVERFAVPESY